MGDFSAAILARLKGHSKSGKLRVGIFYRGNISLVEQIASSGHLTVVAGDNFNQLYRLKKRCKNLKGVPSLSIEAKLDSLPFRKRSLDALILSRGLPKVVSPVKMLHCLSGFLCPGGILIWPHPTSDGFAGRVGKIFAPLQSGILKAAYKHELCHWAMQAGLKDVTQQTTNKGIIAEWVITSGGAGRIWIE